MPVVRIREVGVAMSERFMLVGMVVRFCNLHSLVIVLVMLVMNV